MHCKNRFFHFRTCFCQKVPTSEVGTPSNGSVPPQLEILDPPLNLFQLFPFPVWQRCGEFYEELVGFSAHIGKLCIVCACHNHYLLANTTCDWFLPAILSHEHQYCIKIKITHILFYVSLFLLLGVIKLLNLHAIIMLIVVYYCMLMWFYNPLISLATVLLRTKSLQIGLSITKCPPYLFNCGNWVYQSFQLSIECLYC